MNCKERFLAAIDMNIIPDRLPVTTHHVMPYFLNKYMDGISVDEFFDHFKLDPVLWINCWIPDYKKGDYFDPVQGETGILDSRRICSDNWRIEELSITHNSYTEVKINIHTPVKALSMGLQKDDHTSWVTENLIKDLDDIEIVAKYAPVPLYDIGEINRQAEEFGNKGLVRGFMPMFDIYGQSGCWQDAAVMYGIQNLILKTFEDPEWVHSFLQILCDRKKESIQSIQTAKFDILEHGGGDASTTVISPAIFDKFVAPYDTELTRLANQAGQRIVYHTCGGMMPILESIVNMGVNAIETFTPGQMGGDTNLRIAKDLIGKKVCMIGGFDQFHFFKDCNEEKTRKAVRKCFEEAGDKGGFILSPSDHFFDADPELIKAFADEARKCIY